jgi:hypothetical protein
VCDTGFKVEGLRFGILRSGFRVCSKVFRLRVQGLFIEVRGLSFSVEALEYEVLDFQGVGFRV